MWEPPQETVQESVQKLMECDNLCLENLHLGKEANPNLSHQEIRALNKLRKNQDIVIKPADKGSKIVLMDKTQYLIEANRHLQNPLHYRPRPGSLQRETQEMIKPMINKLHKDRYISHKQKVYLLGPDPPRPCQFYLLPQIHKDPSLWTIPH